MTRVSVIIASYNHESYVAETIQSVLDQTFQDFEIVITDDGSTDQTVREIKRFSDPRIKLFCFSKNQGACVAIRNCLEESNGKYIAVLNSDDAFLPHKLEKQVCFLDEHHQIGAVFGYAQIVDENGRSWSGKKHSYHSIFQQQNRSRYEWLNHFFYKGNCLCHPTSLLRRECYQTVGYLDPRFAQLPDLDFWVRLCMNYDIYILPEELIKFRIRSGQSNISANRPSTLKRSWYEYRHILKHYHNINSSKMLHRIFPETRKYGDDLDSDMIKFIVAVQAIEFSHDSQIYQIFGLDTIFELFEDEKTAKKIAERFDFTFADFIALTGERDCLGIQRIRQQRAFVKHNPIVKFFWNLRHREL